MLNYYLLNGMSKEYNFQIILPLTREFLTTYIRFWSNFKTYITIISLFHFSIKTIFEGSFPGYINNYIFMAKIQTMCLEFQRVL